MKLVKNKIVDTKKLKIALIENISKYSDYVRENRKIFIYFVNEFVVDNVENVACEDAGIDHMHKYNIYDVIDNVDECRDTIAKIVDAFSEEM